MCICQLQYDKLTIRELKVKWLIKSNFINASQRNKKHGRTSSEPLSLSKLFRFQSHARSFLLKKKREKILKCCRIKIRSLCYSHNGHCCYDQLQKKKKNIKGCLKLCPSLFLSFHLQVLNNVSSSTDTRSFIPAKTKFDPKINSDKYMELYLCSKENVWYDWLEQPKNLQQGTSITGRKWKFHWGSVIWSHSHWFKCYIQVS